MADTSSFNFTQGVQRKILALLWQDTQLYTLYRECIKPAYFTRAIDMDICRLLFDYREKYQDAPTQEALTEEVAKLVERSKSKQKLEQSYYDAIDQIANMELHDYEYIKDKVIEFGKKQAMTEAIMQAAEIVQKGRIDEFDQIPKLVESAQRVGEDVTDLGVEYWDGVSERLVSYTEQEDVIERFPTGMKELDAKLKGGLGRTEMGVVLAPPGRGKTTTLINFGTKALRMGANVVHISLENSDAQITRNYDLRMLGKSLEYIREHTDQAIQALGYAKKYGSGQLFIKKYPTKKVTVDTIRLYLNRLKFIKGIDIDMLIVDYGALLKPTVNWNDKRNVIESNYEDLRALADEFQCALWTGAQGNRGSLSKKVVTMGDLAEAFAIANTSDVMIALCQTNREKADNVIRAFVTKNRDGVDSVLLRGTIDYESKVITLDEDITRESLEKSGDYDEEDSEDPSDGGGWNDPGRQSRRRKE